MDRPADYVSLGIVPGSGNGFTLKLAGLTSLLALAVVAAAKLVWNVPVPLLVVVGTTYALLLAMYWIVNRGSSRSAIALVSSIFAIWILVSGTLLTAAYYGDRGGWIWFNLTGYNATVAEAFAGKEDMLPERFLRKNPAFAMDPSDSTAIVLKRGDYSFDETVVIPRETRLTIEAGTILRFNAGRSLISYGPVIARGTESNPIVFTAQNKWFKWGALGVVGDGKSVFEYVRFGHGRQARVNDIDFFGCLSMIGGEVEIRNCRFVHLYGKDGVYVRDGQVLIQNNLFEDTYKDGLDLDGGAGEISGNKFVNCRDEGIDLSANESLSVFDNEILDARGGRIGADHDLETIRARNTLGHSKVQHAMPRLWGGRPQ